MVLIAHTYSVEYLDIQTLLKIVPINSTQIVKNNVNTAV